MKITKQRLMQIIKEELESYEMVGYTDPDEQVSGTPASVQTMVRDEPEAAFDFSDEEADEIEADKPELNIRPLTSVSREETQKNAQSLYNEYIKRFEEKTRRAATDVELRKIKDLANQDALRYAEERAKNVSITGLKENKITKHMLKQLVQEELAAILDERGDRRSGPIHLLLRDKLRSYSHHRSLRYYKDMFNNDDVDVFTVLDALNELMIEFVGPGGFWKSTVPYQWLGCKMNPEIAACQDYQKAAGRGFREVDALLASLGKALDSERTANIFLTKNKRLISSSLLDFVPKSKSAGDASATGFGQSWNMAKYMSEQGTTTDDEL